MKKILSLIILSVFCLNAINAGVTWELSEDSTLTIAGTGDMDDSAPWYLKRKSIKYVVIKKGVTSIGDYAFYGCPGLISVTIPNSVTSIGNSAFDNCSCLTSIIIPNCVTSFGSKVFVCKNLDKITIDANKDLIIEGGSFAYSDLGEIIMCGETLPKSTGDYAFNSKSYETAILYVPSTLYEEYRSTSPWSKFVNIKILDDTVAGIYKSKLERPSASVIYDVNGRRVIDSTLKPGVYIWGGKKIAIK